MRSPFELSWLGGPSEGHFRAARPGVEDLPWGTLSPSRYPAPLLERARLAWTEAAYNEYCTAAAFAELVRAMLEANVPLDLAGMASDFLADEILHVELTSRVAMELGGGAPYEVDFDRLVTRPDPARMALERATELMVRVCCVGEALSVPMLSATMRETTHPLTRQVLERIVRDEAPHARLGWLFLEWRAGEIDAAERRHLADVAMRTLRLFSPFWQSADPELVVHAAPELTSELGFMLGDAYRARIRKAAREEVIAPLCEHGIVLDEGELHAMGLSAA